MDPATVITIIEGAIESWKKYEKGNNFSSWQDDVGSKLNKILENTEKILRDLRNLRVEIEANLDARFQDYFLAALRANISNIGDVLSSIPSGTAPIESQKERILYIADQLRNVLKQSLVYGFAVVPLVLTGYISLIPAMKMGGANNIEINATRQSLLDLVFLPALDQNRVGSFAWALNKSNELTFNLRESLIEALRPTTLAMAWEKVGTIGAVGGFQDFLMVAHAAIARFHGSPDDPASIGVSDIEWVAVEEPKGVFASHVNWNNVSPAPARGVAQRSNSVAGAREIRDALLASYVQSAQKIQSELDSQAQLKAFIKTINSTLGIGTQNSFIIESYGEF